MADFLGKTALGKLCELIHTAFVQAGKTAEADSVTFTDGETFQQKLNEGKLTGPPGKDGAQGKTGPAGPAGPAGKDGNANIEASTVDIEVGSELETGKLYLVYLEA